MEKVSKTKGTQTFLTNHAYGELINTQACESKGKQYPENEDESPVLLEDKKNCDPVDRSSDLGDNNNSDEKFELYSEDSDKEHVFIHSAETFGE